MYYVDLTLRDGVSLKQALQVAQEADQQSKAAGFEQEALDFIARQGFGYASIEAQGEEGLDVMDEFYPEELNQSHTGIADEALLLQQQLRQSSQMV